MIKKILSIFVLIFFISTSGFAAQDIWTKLDFANYEAFFKRISKEKLLDVVIFEIDSEPFTFNDSLKFVNEHSEAKVTLAEFSKNPELFKNTIREMIIRNLLIKEAEESGIKVNLEEVTAYIEEIKRQNKVDNIGFKKLLAKRNLTEDDYKQQVIIDITRSRVVSAKVRSKINVLDTEINKRFSLKYEQVPEEGQINLEQIFISFSTSILSKDEIYKKMQEIKKKAEKGDNLADIAAEDYLDLGFVKPSDLLPALAEVAAKLPENKVSEIIETKEGLYLLKAKEIKEKDKTEISDYEKEKIRKEIYEEKFKTEVDRYISEEIVKKHIINLTINN